MAGNFTLWHFSLPHPIMTALHSLRASGRLFWPGYYLMFAGIIVIAFITFGGRSLYLALGIALILQILDVTPLRSYIYHQWQASTVPSVSSAAAWHDLGRMQKHLVVVPPWQCSFSPGGDDGYQIFGRLAAEQHMTINSFYAGRYDDAQMAFFCNEQMVQIHHNGLQGDTAYVFKGASTALAVFSFP